jgi:glucose/arabinose dehydrogenase/plastocyanin
MNRLSGGSNGGRAKIAGGAVLGLAVLGATLFAAGSSSAATVTVEAGSDWFCDVSFENGMCDTSVGVGDIVSWDVVEGLHTVTECDETFVPANCGQTGQFDSGLMGSGAPLFEQTFNTPGTFEYYCELHQDQMRGRVIVTGATATATPTPMPSPSPTPSPTTTPAPTPTVSPTPTPTPTESPTPTAAPTQTPTATATSPPTPSPSPTPVPTMPPPGSFAVQTLMNTGKAGLSAIAVMPSAPNFAVVTDRGGGLWRVDLTNPAAAPVSFGSITDRVTIGGDEGLLGIAFDPARAGVVYLNYTTGTEYFRSYSTDPGFPVTPVMPANPKRNVIARYPIVNGVIVPSGEQIIYTSLRPHSWHTLNQITFGPDGNLWAGSGDGGRNEAAFDVDGGQGVGNDLATIIRIDPNEFGTGHTIPPGNPFADGAGPNADQVWAFGLRNPFHISFDRLTGEMWSGDSGQWEWEEVNHLEIGGNYGWRTMEGNECHGPNTCTPPVNYTPPRTAYCNHSNTSVCPGEVDCAVIGGHVYRGQGIPGLNGWYVYGDYCSGKIRAVDTSSESSPAVLLVDSDVYPVSFAETPGGEILIVNKDNTIHLLTLAGDTDGDGRPAGTDNCLTAYNPTQSDADGDGAGDACDTGDGDGDGYRDLDEAQVIGVGAGDACGANGWPSELFSTPPSTNELDIQDVSSFVGPLRRLDTKPGDAAFSQRWDLVPGAGAFSAFLNIQDVTALLSGSTAYPPMFSGARAYGKTCPFPP